MALLFIACYFLNQIHAPSFLNENVGLDNSWNVYVFQSFGAPIERSIGTVEEGQPGSWEGVYVQNGDTLAIRDDEPGDTKTALMIWKSRPVKGVIDLYLLKKLDHSSGAARDFIAHFQRELQEAVDKRDWVWPKEGLNLLDSVADFENWTNNEWTASIEHEMSDVNAWNVVLRKVESGSESTGRKQTPQYSWLSSRHGFFKVGSDRRLYYTNDEEGFAGVWLICFDLKSEQEVWSRRLKGSGKYDVAAKNEGAYFQFHDGFIWVFGKEDGQKYVELVDEVTGASLAHRISVGQ